MGQADHTRGFSACIAPHSPCPHLQRLVVQQHPLARVEAEEALRRHPAPRLAPDALRERTPVHGVAEERVVGHLAQAVGAAAEAPRPVGLEQSLAEVPRSRGKAEAGVYGGSPESVAALSSSVAPPTMLENQKRGDRRRRVA